MKYNIWELFMALFYLGEYILQKSVYIKNGKMLNEKTLILIFIVLIHLQISVFLTIYLLKY